MSTEFRVDCHRMDGRRRRRDSRGFLVTPAAVTKTGVFTYKRSDGKTIRELRPPDEVFHPDSLASLDGASVTELHPDGFVTPGNAASLEIGISTAGRRDGAYVTAELSIRRAGAIAKVEQGALVECSCSYTLDVDHTPGVYEGQRYDQIQRNIRYNSVGLGPRGWGRAGRDVQLRMDSNTAQLPMASSHYDDNATRGANMSRQEQEQQRFDAERRERHDDWNKKLEEAERGLLGAASPASERTGLVDSHQRADESDDAYTDRRLDAVEERERNRIPRSREGIYGR